MPKIELTAEAENQIYADKSLLLPLVLMEVNEIRLALAIGEGKLPELPKSIRANPEQCVLARALSNGWSASITRDQMTLFHPAETPNIGNPDLVDRELLDVERRRYELMAETLRQLGYDAWLEHNPWASWSASDKLDLPRETRFWQITIQHTWVTNKMVFWFDDSMFPELFENPEDPGLPLDESEPVEATD
jgi:hypothetical protein